jgi:uncharacterized phage protein (TIGR01671 family)
MREILFRGKRTDTKEWIIGIAFPHDNNKVTMLSQHPIDGSLVGKEVDPETVGQFTGLTDKNGKKIFEGDILTSDCIPYTSEDGKKEYFAEVVWFFDNVPMPAFGVSMFKKHKPSVRDSGYLYNNELWEVIGNKYDNPELLGGADDA